MGASWSPGDLAAAPDPVGAPGLPLTPWSLPRLSGLSTEKHMRITSVSGYERGRSLS